MNCWRSESVCYNKLGLGGCQTVKSQKERERGVKVPDVRQNTILYQETRLKVKVKKKVPDVQQNIILYQETWLKVKVKESSRCSTKYHFISGNSIESESEKESCRCSTKYHFISGNLIESEGEGKFQKFNKIPFYIRKLDWEWKWKGNFQMFSDPSLVNLKQEVVEAKILEVIL